jgi:hypothetical protein
MGRERRAYAAPRFAIAFQKFAQSESVSASRRLCRAVRVASSKRSTLEVSAIHRPSAAQQHHQRQIGSACRILVNQILHPFTLLADEFRQRQSKQEHRLRAEWIDLCKAHPDVGTGDPFRPRGRLRQGLSEHGQKHFFERVANAPERTALLEKDIAGRPC